MLTFIDILVGLLVAAIWGGNFLMTKIGLDVLPPFMLLSLRFFFVAVVLLPFVPRTSLKIKELILLAFTLGVLHHGFLFLSLWLGIDLNASIIIIQASVPITAILGVVILKESLSAKTICGIILSFSGILIIAGDPEVDGDYMVIIMAIFSSSALALFNIQIKNLGDFNVLSMIAYSSVIMTIMLLSISITFEQIPLSLLINLPIKAWVSIIYMIFSTIVGFGLWFMLLKKYPVSKVAPFLLLVPIFGLTFAITFMQKPITNHLIIGGIITIIGVSIIILPEPKQAFQRLWKKKTIV